MSTDGWFWKNIPVPEAHVVGIVIGVVLHHFFPWSISGTPWRQVVGWGFLGGGLAVIRWAVIAVGTQDLEKRAVLVTTGPYRWSRNPMYVAWTVLYAGVAFLVNTVWMVVLLPAVVVACHWMVREEERLLARQYGDAYRAYAQGVPRYR